MDEQERILEELLPETTRLLCEAMALKNLMEKYEQTDPKKFKACKEIWDENSDRFLVIYPQVKVLMEQEIESLRNKAAKK